MTFHSILFRTAQDSANLSTGEMPDYFEDLHLDQIIDTITAGRDDYDLGPYFYAPLHDVESIYYRQEVMRDLEDQNIMVSIQEFANSMNTVRRYLGSVEKLTFNYHKKGWYLETALVYCQAITQLAQALSMATIKSRGLLAFRRFLEEYINSPAFQLLITEAQSVKAHLLGMKYYLIILNSRFKVLRYEQDTDYSLEVESVFEKFKQGAVKDYRGWFRERLSMNAIEAQILEFVARLYPDEFAALDHFCEQHSNFINETIRVFDREIQFYIAYLEFMENIRGMQLAFCYPQVSANNRDVYAVDAFDLALACTMLSTKLPVVVNDYSIEHPERILVITGPNQGGKTTFARMFGQLHHIACLGCPVPGRQARVHLFDRIFTHFEREEDINNLRGNLQDDIVRIHDILDRASPNSIIIVNEIFASTTFQDAVFLSKAILKRVMELDSLCVWVTFIDELSCLSEKTVSLVSMVDPDDTAIRTFKIVRQPANGLAYTLSIAQKHHLTYEQIKERIGR